MTQKVPVLLLTGYLGSGKTTLVNKILTNKRGIKFAVIVNDIGEVNIDADLIQKGGVVGKKDESLVALQNGCICCTLKMDLVEQLSDITRQQKFDYIVIEASGVCEPAPIAQTICSIPTMDPRFSKGGTADLDCIVTVVDAARMQSEFTCGDNLMKKDLDEDDIENLLIQQIEFCNIILLNKVSEVTPSELTRIKQIIRALQPDARIIECDYADIDLDSIINTGMFDFEKVATSATWVKKVEGHFEGDEDEEEHHHDHEEEHGEHHDHEEEHDHDHEEEHEDHHDHEEEHDHDHEEEHEEHHHHHHDHDEDHDWEHDGKDHSHCDHEHGHCCHHHHHHHDGEGEAEEYGIGTFVYQRRKPMDLALFDDFVARKWPKSIIRAKGMCYFRDEFDTCYVFEQAGKQVSLRNAGLWYATMPKNELEQLMKQEPTLVRDWDPQYGDRMQKLVFIGQHLDKAAITKELDKCLVD
ncbi:MAG: GTP-binding protein [Bacteroidaceae bacterium]|nr:GTP-binding protein [Bacteroidaceae bacterium]